MFRRNTITTFLRNIPPVCLEYLFQALNFSSYNLPLWIQSCCLLQIVKFCIWVPLTLYCTLSLGYFNIICQSPHVVIEVSELCPFVLLFILTFLFSFSLLSCWLFPLCYTHCFLPPSPPSSILQALLRVWWIAVLFCWSCAWKLPFCVI